MKKVGASKSGDIRSYFKALSTSQAAPTRAREEAGSSKRKADSLGESDEEDFSKGKSAKNASSSPDTTKSSKKGESSSPKKATKEISSTRTSKVDKSRSSREKSAEKSSPKAKVRKTSSSTEKTRSPSESRSVPTKESPKKSPKKSRHAKQEPEDSGKSKGRDKGSSSDALAKAAKSVKETTVDKVKLKEEPAASSPSGRKKRTAKALQDSDEEDSFNPMPPPSKKKSKDAKYDMTVTPPSKPSVPVTKTTPESTPEEKKRQHAAAYFKFLSRGPPKHLGAKELPEGAPDCLANLTFVLTGVLPSFERDDVVDAIKKYGGRVTTGVSKKTSYVIVGDEPGATKTKKAQDLGVPTVTEDEFLDLIRKSNPNPLRHSEVEESDEFPPTNSEQPNESLFETSAVEETVVPSKPSVSTPAKKMEDFHEFDSDLETPPKVRAQRGSGASQRVTTTPSRKESPSQSKNSEPPARKSLKFPETSRSVDKPVKTEVKPTSYATTSKSKSPVKAKASSPAAGKSTALPTVGKSSAPTVHPTAGKPSVPTAPPTTQVSIEPPILWVDKYKPTSLKQIVGQTGDASNAKKLFRWLQNWFNYHGSADDKAKATWPGLRDPEGKTFKAALLSGPPGVGKTTTAHLCCKELGYDFIEMNASDQRNKKGLELGLSDSLSNLSIRNAATGSNKGMGRKHVLVMDEVDGMSGNEDRGGIQELIALIKTSRVPIICICNDRQHQKIRSLANYCFDLRFTKPRYEQLKSFVQSICFKEKLKIAPEMLQQLIISTDQDVRQILHQLQLFKSSTQKSSYDPRKDLHLGPWEVVRKVFSGQDHKGMSINDKQSLFFHDYSFGPLFVYENYLRSIPSAANGDPYKTMDLVKAAAESLATGDRVEKIIRSNNAWSLLPVQAVFASVLPGEYMEGTGMLGIEFPQWLGKNSNRNKRHRLLQELHTHMHLQISGSVEALNMDYAPYLRRAIVNPLVRGEADVSAKLMHDYCLLRDDLESLTEVAVWPNMKDLFEKVDSKTKAAFTRHVNKEAFVPYSIVKVTKGKGKAGGGDDELEGLEGDDGDAKVGEDEEEEEVDPEKDAMIKVKKPRGKAATKAGTSKSSGPKSKAKRGKGSDVEIDSDSEEEVKPKGKGKKSSGGASKSRKK